MDDLISTEWQLLYAFNPHVQAFGVCRGTQVLWQTTNWDLVGAVSDIVKAPQMASPSVKVNKVDYSRVASTQESYIGTANKNRGHLIIYRIENDSWVVAWVAPEATPELTKIDVARTATKLIGLI
jgi:hypothetical protein